MNRYEIKCTFDSNGRKVFPNLNDTYRPHIVINGDSEYLGIQFESSSLNAFGVEGTAIIRTIYDGVNYDCLQPSVRFVIMEGAKQVGKGEIVKTLD